MKEMSIEEIHECCLGILKAFDAFCEKEDIKYYLLGGSALGAVRHRGFIPWDDDIDVGVWRKDYNIICEKFIDNDIYSLSSMEREIGYTSPYAKLRDNNTLFIEPTSMNPQGGLFIDVFPIDYIKKSRVAIKRALLRKLLYSHAFIRNLDSGAYAKENPAIRTARKLLSSVYRKQDPASVVKRIERDITSEDYSDVIMNLWGYWGKREIVDSSWFSEGVEMQFEDMVCRVPKEWHYYLTQLYGDYMTPPSNPTHSHGSAYWL